MLYGMLSFATWGVVLLGLVSQNPPHGFTSSLSTFVGARLLLWRGLRSAAKWLLEAGDRPRWRQTTAKKNAHASARGRPNASERERPKQRGVQQRAVAAAAAAAARWQG